MTPTTGLLDRRRAGMTGLLLATALLAGCGGTDGDSNSGAGAVSSAPSSSAPSSEASAAPSSSSSAEAAAAPQMVAVPTQDDGAPGLKNATEFPVPAGATVSNALGAPFNGSWQFTLAPTSPEDLAAFYSQVLPEMGYTVSTDAKVSVGANDIEFLVGWTGPTSGTVDRSGIISVNDRPVDGLSLDGKPVGDPAS